MLLCRKRPPTAKRSNGQAVWPVVKADDWCGEFLEDETPPDIGIWEPIRPDERPEYEPEGYGLDGLAFEPHHREDDQSFEEWQRAHEFSRDEMPLPGDDDVPLWEQEQNEDW